MKFEGHSKILEGNYQITRTESGLRVETLDYHAGPVTISFEDLEEFGFVRRRRRRSDRRTAGESTERTLPEQQH